MFLALMFLTTAMTTETEGRDWIEIAKGTPFVYAGAGRRDPFLFRTRVPTPPPIDLTEDGVETILEVRERFKKRPRTKPGETVADSRQVGQIIGRAKAELQAGNFRRAKTLAEQARRKVVKDHPPELMQTVERVHRASELLTQRRQAEEEFGKLSIRIDAIFWNLDEPVAMISGRTHREGDVLDNDLQIYRIEKSGVVFLFKNFLKVRKRLGWMSRSGGR